MWIGFAREGERLLGGGIPSPPISGRLPSPKEKARQGKTLLRLALAGKGSFAVEGVLPRFLALWEVRVGAFLVFLFLLGSLSVLMFCVGGSSLSMDR